MLIVSYFTNNGTYPQQAKRLADSCQRFGLRHVVQEVSDKGSWARGCNYKPSYILDKLITAREAILCLDCDCEIMSLPTLLFGASCDFAAYNFAADTDESARIYTPYNPEKLLVSGGVLYFAYTAPALELVCRWLSALNTDENTKETDAVLDCCFNVAKVPTKNLWLPSSYNHLNDRWPNVVPVIEHHYKAGLSREAVA